MTLSYLKLRVPPEEFVAHLADAICRVFLDHGFEGSIAVLEKDLQKAFQEVIEKRRPHVPDKILSVTNRRHFRTTKLN